ncbi:hypothetical protein XELAEV_18002719mg [Xenopus laevis]|uniref:Uncharacterized protein n=1 Tax=Xenopus laevis TaxID=8355 RepID=A0A974BNG7_XENLA|nr:hypothetical protein XELAEV_18002719mg [Xenopus laevis]
MLIICLPANGDYYWCCHLIKKGEKSLGEERVWDLMQYKSLIYFLNAINRSNVIIIIANMSKHKGISDTL